MGLAVPVTKRGCLCTNTTRHERFAGLPRWPPPPAPVRARLPPHWPTAWRRPPEAQLVLSDWISIWQVDAKLPPDGLAGPHLPGTLWREQRPLCPQPLAQLFQRATHYWGAAWIQGNATESKTSSPPPILACVLCYQPFKLSLNSVPNSLFDSNATHILHLVSTEAQH